MFKKREPFYIEVSESRYNMYSEPTFRNRFIAGLVQRMGGISETVSPGTYILDVKIGFFKIMFDLREA